MSFCWMEYQAAMRKAQGKIEMTKAQIKKLETLIGKLEALQHEVRDDACDLYEAKKALTRFLSKASR